MARINRAICFLLKHGVTCMRASHRQEYFRNLLSRETLALKIVKSFATGERHFEIVVDKRKYFC